MTEPEITADGVRKELEVSESEVDDSALTRPILKAKKLYEKRIGDRIEDQALADLIGDLLAADYYAYDDSDDSRLSSVRTGDTQESYFESTNERTEHFSDAVDLDPTNRLDNRYREGWFE